MPEKIMLVDDDQAILQMMSDGLSRYPYQIVTYWDPRLAREALDGPPESLPAVIVTDVMMPGLDGYTFVNSLREGDETRSIPVIVVTAKRSVIDVFRDLPNVFVFLEKPFAMTAFVDAVQRALAKAAA